MKFILLITLMILSSYVSSPAHIPNFANFTTPVIKPGEEGKFNFTIENRYVAPMYDVELHIEIYLWATEEESKTIDDIPHRPVIAESGSTKYTINLGTIRPEEKKAVMFHIKTYSSTPSGVYFVRFSIFFNYNGTLYKMWSPGYFPRNVWDNATKNHQLNLSYLSDYLGERVDGIVPDSSFSVKGDMLWLLYVLIGLTVLVGIAALYSYYHERKVENKIDEQIYRLKGKYRELEEKVREKLMRRQMP